MTRVTDKRQAILGAALLAAVTGLSPAASAQVGNEPSRQEQIRQDNDQFVPQRKSDKIFPTSMNWVAVSLNGKPLASGANRPSFYIDEQLRARGFGGCNNFSATAFPLRQQKFAVGPIAHTRKACDKGLADMERRFFVAFRTAVQWDLVGGQLVLKGQGGELRLERGI